MKLFMISFTKFQSLSSIGEQMLDEMLTFELVVVVVIAALVGIVVIVGIVALAKSGMNHLKIIQL